MGGASALDIVEQDGLTAIKGAGFVLSAQARWEGGGWLKFSAVVIGTASSSGQDNDVRTLMQKHHSSRSDDLVNATMQYSSALDMIRLSAGGMPLVWP